MHEMRSILVILSLCFATSALAADDKTFRFGVQTSLNSYKIDDPAGKTAGGSGLSFSGIALVDVGRESRVMLNLDRDSYSVAGSNVNVGQDVSSIGGGLSYQKMLRISRSWRPWIGAGLGYSSATYSNRYVFTSPAMQFKTLYGDRKTTETLLLLNANSEWQYSRDFDIGLQAQFSKAISDKSSTLRVGIYVVY
jgi:hypothetical protein